MLNDIRQATTNDLVHIAKIHFDAWQTVYRHQIPDTYLNALKLEDFIIQWKAHIKNPGTSLWRNELFG